MSTFDSSIWHNEPITYLVSKVQGETDAQASKRGINVIQIENDNKSSHGVDDGS